MFRKSLAFILLGATTCAVSYAQTPAPKGQAAASVFSFFDGSGSYLGIDTEEVTKENFAKYGLREVRGVAIEKVVDGSPAQSAGLQNGDVVVKFNGEDITSVRKLSRLIEEVAPDHQAKLTVMRNGDSREIIVTLGRRPTSKFENGAYSVTVPGGRMPFPHMSEMPAMPALPPMSPMLRVQVMPSMPEAMDESFIWSGGSSRRIGVNTTPLTKQLSEHFGVSGGVLVSNVRVDSPAAKAGLRAGDLIVEVDGKQVSRELDLIRSISEKKEGDVSLTIVRDRSRQSINVTPEESKGEFNTFFEGFEGEVAPVRRTMAVPAAPVVPGTPVPLNRIYRRGRIL
ncbi:MAG: PDZ domain-containing protein [Saprospiraceae bacterium]|nr:PDZ domain-containing protein [Pyrinomonadaceae bacterium]